MRTPEQGACNDEYYANGQPACSPTQSCSWSSASHRPAQARFRRHSAPGPGWRWASSGPLAGRLAANRTRQPIRRGDRV